MRPQHMAPHVCIQHLHMGTLLLCSIWPRLAARLFLKTTSDCLSCLHYAEHWGHCAVA